MNDSTKHWTALGQIGDRLADTPKGREWLDKVLHPASAHIADGIPDLTNAPVVTVNHQSAYTLEKTGITGPWNLAVRFLPHPVIHGVAWTYEGDPTAPTHSHMQLLINKQLISSTHDGANAEVYEKTLDFTSMGPNARIQYHSATAQFDAAYMTNQGVMTATQYRVPRTDYVLSQKWDTGTPEARASLVTSGDPTYTLETTNFIINEISNTAWLPTFENALTYPTSANWEARQGAYMVNKLLQPDIAFRSSSADHMLSGIAPDLNIGGDAELNQIRTCGSLNGSDMFMFMKNLDVTSNVRLIVRQGLEVMVSPGSTLSPYVHNSPPIDYAALRSYQHISAMMKDAYPSDHNDLGKIVNILANMARQVLPALQPLLRVIPVAGKPLAELAGMAAKIPKNPMKSKKKQQTKKPKAIEGPKV